MTLNSRISIFLILLLVGINGPEYDLVDYLWSKRQSVARSVTLRVSQGTGISGYGYPKDGYPKDGYPKDGIPEAGIPEAGIPEAGIPGAPLLGPAAGTMRSSATMWCCGGIVTCGSW